MMGSSSSSERWSGKSVSKSGKSVSKFPCSSRVSKGPVGGETVVDHDWDDEIKDLKKCDVRVGWIRICGTPLSNSSGHEGPLCHNFLIIDVSTTGSTNVANFMIRAEKTLDEEERGKIQLSVCRSFRTEWMREEVALNANIPGEKLVEILEKYHTPVYSLLHDNCWRYADDVYRRLIREFIDTPDTDMNEVHREELRTYLKGLPASRSPRDAVILFVAGLVAGCVSTVACYVFVLGPTMLPVGVVGIAVFSCSDFVIPFVMNMLFFQFVPFVCHIFEALKPGLPKDFSWREWARCGARCRSVVGAG